MDQLRPLVSEIRALRADLDVPIKELVPVIIYGPSIAEAASRNLIVVKSLARVSELKFSEKPLSGPDVRNTANFDVCVLFKKQIDISAERERLTKEITKYEKGLISAERQLGNEGFVAKAPAYIVEGLKKQEAETRLLLEKARAALDNLTEEK
jgi:valyl-tRNA synthetase